ncbi:hypothetical protein [Halomonas rhizosphaerae]|uniref:Integrase n=1 Tax=Halomonas rhizosphaerae TaxID=3043296 RepID=A0ABT6UXN0_9GAMM|nr:hypothetical protein [Halomonas rhizosphaerae]MDI5890727.1 hypothetical protein [Halomonas rhizosphaerae]
MATPFSLRLSLHYTTKLRMLAALGVQSKDMAKRTFDNCALHYLNQWLDRDSYYCEALSSKDESRQLAALKKAGAFYRVARNLPGKHETEKKVVRYKPVLDVLNAIDGKGLTIENLDSLIIKANQAISGNYGGRETLSLTTKFMWLKFRSPVKIYDSQARAALRTKAGDISSFNAAWMESFQKHYAEIQACCERLFQISSYSNDPRVATPDYIKAVGNQTWFQERVFDVYLWNLGSA